MKATLRLRQQGLPVPGPLSEAAVTALPAHCLACYTGHLLVA